MAQDQVTEEIRRRADLVEVVGQYVQLKSAGGDRFKACCPFHDEKTPSFYVSRDKGFYKCFGCLDAQELIWTRDGLKAIGEVTPGEWVWDGKGNWSAVAAVQAKTKPLLELRTGAFRRDPLRLSPDHRCLFVPETEALRALPFLHRVTGRGTKFKSSYRRYKSKAIALHEARADELKPGDFWLFPVIDAAARCVAPLRAPDCIKPHTSGPRVNRLTQLPVSAEAAFVYGLYLAEGSTNPRSVRWTFHHDEKDLALEIARVLKAQFDLPAAHFLYPQHTTREVICSKTDLARLFERWFGKGAAGKRLPAEALNWPVEIQKALLAGYMCGDGGKKGLAPTVSRELAYGLFALAIQCGLNASLSRQNAFVDPKNQAHREYWLFNLKSREGLNGFFHPLGEVNYYWSRISHIEAGAAQAPVVDISVPGPDSFVTKLGATHNCGKSGDAFRFLMEQENMSFPEARRMLGERYGIKVPERREMTAEQKEELSARDKLLKVTAASAHFFREQLGGNAGLIARDYARKRGLSRETLEKFGIGYAPDAWDALKLNLTRKYGFSDDDGIASGMFIEKKSEDDELGGMFAQDNHKPRRVYDRYRHRLMFPIWDESGRVIAFGGRALEGGEVANSDAKYINSPESELFHKSNILFAWHLARPEVSKRDGVIITEGYMDAIALHEGGFPNTVATLGTALTANHVALLKRMAPKTVWLCFDGDSAGMRAALRTAPLFARNALEVRVVVMPPGHDPDTFVREEGAAALTEKLESAPPLSRYRLETVVASHDMSDLAARAGAMREAAEIINDISDQIEREGYINYLVDTLLRLEKPSNRSDWEKRRTKIEALVESELRADSTTWGANQRLREARAPEATLSKTERPKNPFYAKKDEERRKAADDLREATQAIVASDVPSGVVKAEKALLGALLGYPVWREYILEKLPLAKWTDEIHAEIYIAARAVPDGDEINPMQFNGQLGRKAQEIVAEVMMAPEASQMPEEEVVDDWIWRVEYHWALQAESEVLEMVSGKIEREEIVTDEEKAILNGALRATRRKVAFPTQE